ncbi:MAG: hypothetical protein ACKOC5_08650 [Chloroflexota bacterium]
MTTPKTPARRRPKFVYLDSDGIPYSRPPRHKLARQLTAADLAELRRRYEVILLRAD